MDTGEILQKLQTEKAAGKEEGTIDIIWINGENFKNAKNGELLYGPIQEILPHFASYYDTESDVYSYDFGTEIAGLEAPWGKVQFVFNYDEEKIPNPPTTVEELVAWVEENPGKFTYPNPSDFTGNAFLRHILYSSAGGYETFLEEGFSEELAEDSSQELWTILNDMKENLWRSGDTYPSDLTELDRLYSQGEVWMTMGYNEARAGHMIEDGVFPETTKSFVLEDVGSIGNTHFLAVPFNSPNKSGALVAINALLSPEAQYVKMTDEYWGESTPISLDKLDDEYRQKFEGIERSEAVLSKEELDASFVPEIDAGYVEWLKEQWTDEVVEKP
ncbi:ABC transporter substrate-binding protein [Bacillus coahuilensis]|nr:ABC transporter substrate-binding protein [Bacillus coahuilensis]